MLDCCLVNMPFSDLKRPSLALGILQGILRREGFSVHSLHANLLHAESTGLWLYLLYAQSASRTLIGDWCFVDQAFPGAAIDHEGYLEHFCRTMESLRVKHLDHQRLKDALKVSKARAEDFLDQMVERILALEPRVVGCTSTFMQRMASLALLRRLKKAAPYELVTMMGGANCEAEMGRASHRYFPWVDYVVSGEADQIIAPLLRLVLDQGRAVPADQLPTGVFGPVHRDQGYPDLPDGRAPRATATAFGDQGAPDYGDYFALLEETPCLQAALRPALPFETSRGCWWGEKPGCRFCGLCGQAKTFRAAPAGPALAALKELIHRHQVRDIAMADNILDPEFFAGFLPALADAPWAQGSQIFYETRSVLSLEQLRALRRARVTYIQAGVESLHSQCLKAMNKGCLAVQNIETLKWCLQAGVRVVWHILYDLPGEKDEWYAEMAQYLPLLHHLPRPTLFTFIKFDRFSEYFEHAQRHGLELEPTADHAFLYPIPPQGLMELAYDFDDKTRAAFQLNPMAPLLRPQGQEAARAAYFAWQRSWSAENGPPRLVMRDGPEGLVIEDTRAVATAPRHVLTGLAREIYLACRSARRRGRLVERMVERGHPAAAVERAIAGLTEAKLSLAIDQRLLSLAIEEPDAPYPTMDASPLGGLAIGRFWEQWVERQRQKERGHA